MTAVPGEAVKLDLQKQQSPFCSLQCTEKLKVCGQMAQVVSNMLVP
jgi:hypothetical protein